MKTSWGYSVRDGKTVAQWFERQNFYEISRSELNALKSEMRQLSGQEIDSAAILVLHFIPDYATCYSGNSDHLNYSRKQYQFQAYKKLVSENKDISYFFVTQNTTSKYLSNKIPILRDANRYLENKFFPTAGFTCPSLLIIHPSGAYFLHRGEHRRDLINEVLAIFRKTIPKN